MGHPLGNDVFSVRVTIGYHRTMKKLGKTTCPTEGCGAVLND